MSTRFLRDSVEELPTFSVNLDGAALNRRLAEASVACVQTFVRSPRFTQLDFFSDNGINILVSALNAAGSIGNESTYEPWANVLSEVYEAIVFDLKKAFDDVDVRRKNARDTSERWFGVRSVESSEVGEPSCWIGVRILDVVEAGQIQYLSESILAPDQPCISSTTKPCKARERENEKELRHPPPLLHPSGYLKLMMNQCTAERKRGVF